MQWERLTIQEWLEVVVIEVINKVRFVVSLSPLLFLSFSHSFFLFISFAQVTLTINSTVQTIILLLKATSNIIPISQTACIILLNSNNIHILTKVLPLRESARLFIPCWSLSLFSWIHEWWCSYGLSRMFFLFILYRLRNLCLFVEREGGENERERSERVC